MKTIAQKLSEYSHSLKYADLPKEVVHEVKRRIIDSLGCAIGAFDSEPAKIARKIAQDAAAPQASSPQWGEGRVRGQNEW